MDHRVTLLLDVEGANHNLDKTEQMLKVAVDEMVGKILAHIVDADKVSVANSMKRLGSPYEYGTTFECPKYGFDADVTFAVDVESVDIVNIDYVYFYASDDAATHCYIKSVPKGLAALITDLYNKWLDEDYDTEYWRGVTSHNWRTNRDRIWDDAAEHYGRVHEEQRLTDEADKADAQREEMMLRKFDYF